MTGFELAHAPSGGRCLKKEGKVYGGEDPAREAQAQIASLHITVETDFILLGLSLGYNLYLLDQCASSASKFIVIERDIHLLFAALVVHDFSHLMSANRLMLIGDAGPGDTLLAFSKIAPYVAMFSPQILELSPATALYSDYYQKINNDISHSIKAAQVGFQSAIHLSEPDIFNRLDNLPAYLSSCLHIHNPLQLQPTTTAVLVAAGPSLQGNIRALHKAGDVHICAVGTAAQSLLAEGIIPHSIVTMDYSVASLKYLEAVTIPEGAQWPLLIVDARANPRAVQVYKGPHVFLPDEKLYKLCTGKVPTPLDVFKPAATVAHQAFCFLERMGFATIILCGLDLGNPYGVTHIPGIATYDDWHQSLNRFYTYEMLEWEQILRFRTELVRSVDIDGNPLYTDTVLLAYLHSFNKAILMSASRIIDSTEGGACKSGAERMPLATALALGGTTIPFGHTAKLTKSENSEEYTSAHGYTKDLHSLLQTLAQLENAIETNAPLEEVQTYQQNLSAFSPLIDMAETLLPQESLDLKKIQRHLEAESDPEKRHTLQKRHDIFYITIIKKGAEKIMNHLSSI